MADRHTSPQDDSFWAPGTVRLEDSRNLDSKIILHPTPSSDPNDPLNWPVWRKAANFLIASFYVLMTFVQLDITFTAWSQYQQELGFSISVMNSGGAFNYAGLGVGCFFFVPLVHKYGRRPLYIVSSLIQLAACVWAAMMHTRADFWASSFFQGLGGAISETIVQITIADLFFVHHHAAMNGAYLFFVATGAFLGPVASGYVVQNQGWRWIWWWCTILLGVNLICILFLFEESKFVSLPEAQPGIMDTLHARPTKDHDEAIGQVVSGTASDEYQKQALVERTRSQVHFDPAIPTKSYWQRMRLITKTDTPILRNMYQPIVLFSFPAVTYTALTYASTLAAFATITSVQAAFLLLPPYNFTPSGIGLMNLAPFIGTFPGIFFGGYMNDKSILWLSKRNKGIYEPEMRLWLSLPLAVLTAGSVLMVGLGIAKGAPWPLVACGFGILGFCLAATGSIALSYSMDCYHDVIGNAMVIVVLSRNVLGLVVMFTVTPWIQGMGVQNMIILISMLVFVILLAPILLLILGKKARIAFASKYKEMARWQSTSRQL